MQTKEGQCGGFSFINGAIKNGVNDRPGCLDGDALAGAIPAGIDQISGGAVGFHLFHQFFGVLGGVQGQKRRTEAGGEGGCRLSDTALGTGQFGCETGEEVVFGLLWRQA